MDIDLHKYIGYTVFLVAVCNLILAMSSARKEALAAKMMQGTHAAFIWVGRLEILAGIGLVANYKDVWLTSQMGYCWQAWVSILLWGPVEVVAKRMIRPDLDVIQDGGEASSRLATGAGIQLVVMLVIFGLMHTINPG